MIPFSLRELQDACGGALSDPAAADILITSIETDSRKAKEGTLFGAICGSRVDGHDFIPAVQRQGAAAALCEKTPADCNIPYILVSSTIEALQKIAAFILEKTQIPVVAVIGSVGKTSTKEMIAQVLSQKMPVLKTRGNLNNRLGLPMTVFGLEKEHRAAVLELGISNFGEMHVLGKVARPKVCVMTNIGDCHLEDLGDRDGVFKAKSEIFDHLREDAAVILNGDDEKLSAVSKVQGKPPVFYGTKENAAVRASKTELLGFEGSRCLIAAGGKSVPVKIGIPGEHMVLNALAAAAVGLTFGMELSEIAKGIEKCETIGGRFNVIHTKRFTVVDDCYNANPVSMEASLKILSGIPGRSVAVLGDMGELGSASKQLHEKVGKTAAGLRIDLICCVGKSCEDMAAAVRENGGNVSHFADNAALIEKLPQLLCDGDTILIKASHFMNFPQVLEHILLM